MTKGETMKKHILFDADEIQFVFILNHSWCLSVYPKQWCDVWEFLMFVPTLPRNSQTISCFYIEDILFARPCRCPLCFPLCLLGSFLLPVICAQSLKIAVRSFPLIMYLGLKSIMILKILISIINLYIYISGSCFQYHGVSTPVSKVWLKNAPDPFSAQLWWQHWATRLWCDGFMSRCYNEWLNSIDSIDTLSWCKSNANI